MSDNPNSSNILSNKVQPKGKIVLSKIHPKTSDKSYIALLEAVAGAGNVVILEHEDYVKYLGAGDLLTVYHSEKVDPLSQNIDNGGDISTLTPANIVFPAPTNLKVISRKIDQATGKMTVTVQFNAVDTHNSQGQGKVTYNTSSQTPLQQSQAPFASITNIKVTAHYPTIAVTFNTIPDAVNYVGTITKTDTKQTASAISTPAQAANTGSMTFTGVPHGTYNFSVSAYNNLGITGKETTYSGVITV